MPTHTWTNQLHECINRSELSVMQRGSRAVARTPRGKPKALNCLTVRGVEAAQSRDCGMQQNSRSSTVSGYFYFRVDLLLSYSVLRGLNVEN